SFFAPTSGAIWPTRASKRCAAGPVAANCGGRGCSTTSAMLMTGRDLEATSFGFALMDFPLAKKEIGKRPDFSAGSDAESGGAACAQDRLDFAGGTGHGEKIALADAAAGVGEELALRVVLDALGDDFE